MALMFHSQLPGGSEVLNFAIGNARKILDTVLPIGDAASTVLLCGMADEENAGSGIRLRFVACIYRRSTNRGHTLVPHNSCLPIIVCSITTSKWCAASFLSLS
jgi:hypothetical protein